MGTRRKLALVQLAMSQKQTGACCLYFEGFGDEQFTNILMFVGAPRLNRLETLVEPYSIRNEPIDGYL